MNIVRSISIPALILSLASGCIRPEAPNVEADILGIQVEGAEVLRDPVITNDQVTLYVNPWEDLTHVTPTFVMTDGASISPESGKTMDFTKPVTYTVTSEDGQWSKSYVVTFTSGGNVEKQRFSFEDTFLQGNKYYVFQIKNDAGEVTDNWASSNTGYSIGAEFGLLPGETTDYPVTQVDAGYTGKAVQLSTRSTKALYDAFGSVMNVPMLAAGSLYLGKLNTDFLMTDALKSTEFGIPVFRKPVMLTGYYKYTPGETMIDDKGNALDRTDLFDIYGIVYEVTPEVKTLDGTNNLTSDNLVMKARISDDDRKPEAEWTRFEIPFEMLDGKSIDPVKLSKGMYNYSIVFSSSKDGAKFFGAAGSTLQVDEVEVYFE